MQNVLSIKNSQPEHLKGGFKNIYRSPLWRAAAAACSKYFHHCQNTAKDTSICFQCLQLFSLSLMNNVSKHNPWNAEHTILADWLETIFKHTDSETVNSDAGEVREFLYGLALFPSETGSLYKSIVNHIN